MQPRVLLVHGLLNASWWLLPLALRLRKQGFATELFDYSSVWEGPEFALPRLRKRLLAQPPDALVGHSLGGLIALTALQQAEHPRVQRVVCLGSPLRGSETARCVAALPWARPLLGRSAGLLQTGVAEWRGTAEVGVVAGIAPRGMGCLFAHFKERSDGTVALEETRLPWLADHVALPCSHSGLVLSHSAARQTGHFLHHGQFAPTSEHTSRAADV
ncbi:MULTISPECIES: alpha/beta fold hydrolase [Thermomonas]|jgi:pimeloyl-ACP methyl ester carboxylesterase|uniref:Alpha/beta fold hydrolase n=1 Tax=Thermomonas beijingensis TaxID=2872701 RepID=A0ABS7TB85_9GAMM|nr:MULTISPECIES: alpha/beta fold hydrolase [Thermomonas]MBS0458943.1 alpha/beta fold hydrolase [Pseudomonadota bacterium]MDE2382627.1 alpha/beta fold hydrolase [Xanthomonadaceae bacterium]MBZ4185103.1 alpha/beta fold hydrolase [Thermomonas beijingensis]HOV95393.1 alpha/beta fold hydrolase [Thermomonas sp.]HQA02015.1 alpha/beta fold hydrolase [Thermomonas sp.]